MRRLTLTAVCVSLISNRSLLRRQPEAVFDPYRQECVSSLPAAWHVSVQMANAADTEAGCDGQLTRIQDVPIFLHAVVKLLKPKAGSAATLKATMIGACRLSDSKGANPRAHMPLMRMRQFSE